MAYDSDRNAQAMVDDLCSRLTDICQDYDSETIFVALAELLTITCAEATRIKGLDEFLEVFARRVRSIWLEQQITGRPQ